MKMWLEPDWIKSDFIFLYQSFDPNQIWVWTALDCKTTSVTYTLAFKYAIEKKVN